MENTWLRDAPYTPAMFSDPFAYRARLSDADLDFYDERSRLNNADSVMMGLITQEEADRRYKERQAYREKRKEEDRYLEIHVDAEWDTSDDSFDEDTPLTPPRSPNHQSSGIDLSVKAWNKECSLIRLRKRFDLRDFGFEDYETWKQYQIKHSQPPPSHSPPILQPRSRQGTRASRGNFKRLTRSQTQNTSSLEFYELSEDGKTRRMIPALSRDRQLRSYTLGASHRPRRVQKRPRKKIP